MTASAVVHRVRLKFSNFNIRQFQIKPKVLLRRFLSPYSHINRSFSGFATHQNRCAFMTNSPVQICEPNRNSLQYDSFVTKPDFFQNHMDQNFRFSRSLTWNLNNNARGMYCSLFIRLALTCTVAVYECAARIPKVSNCQSSPTHPPRVQLRCGCS